MKCDSFIGLLICGFLVVSNSINVDPLRVIGFQNVGDFNIDLSRSLKVKCDGVIGVSIYGSLLIFNSNMA